MVASAIIGIANYSIYMATIDYMITAYGPYSASATGGNGWSRDFLAGVLTIPATPFFENIGARPLQYASTILACIATVLVMAVYVIYVKGPILRARSPFAQQLNTARKDQGGRRVSTMPGVYGSRRQSYAASGSRPGSRNASIASGHANANHEKVRQRAAKANKEFDAERREVV